MSKFRRSLIITFFSSTGATVVQFMVSLVLARMLSPKEIGVFSITVVFVNIAHIFRDFGVGAYLQREVDLTPEKIRAAIGVLFTTSWTIAVALFCLSGWIAQWFHEPTISPVMRVLATGFLFIPFGAITHALLVRNFSAEKEAVVMVIGTAAYSATCLGLAWAGFGTMSLAWANLVNIIVCAISLTPYRPKGVPWGPSFRNWKSVAHFGAGSLLSNCLNAINNSIPDMLLGRLGGARQVGLFSRAGSTVGIFYYIVGATAGYGALSYISQANSRGEPLTPLLNKAAVLLTGIGWPILGVTAVLGRQIVLALYGPNWLDSVEAIPALALATSIGLMFNYVPTALLAVGRIYLSGIPVAVTLVVRIIMVFALFDGKLSSFAEAICIATVVSTPVVIIQQSRYLGYHLKDMLRAVYPSAIVALMCMATAAIADYLLPGNIPALAGVFIAAVPITAVWYGSLRLTKHPLLKEVHNIATGVRNRFAKVT